MNKKKALLIIMALIIQGCYFVKNTEPSEGEYEHNLRKTTGTTSVPNAISKDVVVPKSVFLYKSSDPHTLLKMAVLDEQMEYEFKNIESGEYDVLIHNTSLGAVYRNFYYKDSTTVFPGLDLEKVKVVKIPMHGKSIADVRYFHKEAHVIDDTLHLYYIQYDDNLKTHAQPVQITFGDGGNQESKYYTVVKKSEGYVLIENGTGAVLQTDAPLMDDNLSAGSGSFEQNLSSASEPELSSFPSGVGVHTVPGKIEAEHYVDPALAEKYKWYYYESDTTPASAKGEVDISACRTEDQENLGIDLLDIYDGEASRTEENYSEAPCSDAAGVLGSKSELLSYALRFEEDGKYRLKVRAGVAIEDSIVSKVPMKFVVRLYNLEEMEVMRKLSVYFTNTGELTNFATFLPQMQDLNVPRNENCGDVIMGHEALMNEHSDCWLSQLNEGQAEEITKGDWLMAIDFEDGDYLLNYFEIEKVDP